LALLQLLQLLKPTLFSCVLLAGLLPPPLQLLQALLQLLQALLLYRWIEG
jgi:hypothetical protein